MSRNFAFIGLGSNVGDRLNLIVQAKELIKQMDCNITQQSSIYETPPWGFEAEQHFLNQIIQVTTSMEPSALINELLAIEKKLGRIRVSEDYASRTMDLDILFFNNDILNENNLTIPHPRLHLRNFVLVPMNEIAPNYKHPVLNLTINKLLLQCTDATECKKFLI